METLEELEKQAEIALQRLGVAEDLSWAIGILAAAVAYLKEGGAGLFHSLLLALAITWQRIRIGVKRLPPPMRMTEQQGSENTAEPSTPNEASRRP